MQFYTQLFTSNRGPLARIWLACHWEKKITKAQVFECNLETSIQDIICPQIKIGLRTSGHLLLGVVRIYSRKAKYLLADCSEAVVKIKVAFRPGQLDLPEDGKEARLKSITLPEDFADFDSQLPDPKMFNDVVDISLNQSRMEEITLREDFGDFPLMMDSFSARSLGERSEFDGFGDEGLENTLLDFMIEASNEGFTDIFDSPHKVPRTPPPTAINQDDVDPNALEVQVEPCSPQPPTAVSFGTMNETVLVENEAEYFALEPVPTTPTLERKRGKKRRLMVDARKELTNEEMRRMLQEADDLIGVLDLAPPTRQLMEWKTTGGVEWLFRHYCAPAVYHPDLLQIFPRNMFPGKPGSKEAGEESDPEEMRNQHREEVSESSVLPVEERSLLHESVDQSKVSPPPAEEGLEELSIVNLHSSECRDNVFSLPDPVSEDSLLVHLSGAEREMPPSVPPTPRSQVEQNTEEMEDERLMSRAQRLLQALKGRDPRPNAIFSLQELCLGSSRAEVAAMFFSLLVLRKQGALDLHQSAPYSEIIATPGPRFTSV
ncbi:double-strand-break repair protein rad21-like protein 1 [Clupea harengus]|uniref:Double-strand-break repair protein rad21-like protein 1 n=1 Tax=Clupea harengus TaxID=7950 RepID=A0A6P8FCH8_CLUHA|nr:double-strand-break repair protein rad21-like protein 1 [Clupea harengus]